MKKSISIEQGEIDKIIGSPSYGLPVVTTNVNGFTNKEALIIITQLQQKLIEASIAEAKALEDRIYELSKKGM